MQIVEAVEEIFPLCYDGNMDLISVLIFSIVEGLTEFLPISSTGHLVLTARLLQISQTEFVKSFEVIIQLGAVAAVAVLYGKQLLTDKNTLFKIAAAFIPTGILGLLLYKLIKTFLIGNIEVTLASLFLGGIAIILLELYFQKHQKQEEIKNLSYKNAVIIGVFQSLSMIPGVSRAAATIFGGMIVGLSREEAVKFSFILAIPTMLAATGMDLAKNFRAFNFSEIISLAVGFTASFLVAWVVVKWFLGFVRHASLIPFGIYRIILAIIFFLMFF